MPCAYTTPLTCVQTYLALRGVAGVDGDNQPAELMAFYGYFTDVVSSLKMQRGNVLVLFWEELLTKMGFEREDVLDPNIPFFPCNSWMGTPGFVKRYKAFALKTAAFIEDDPELHFRAYQNAYYAGRMSKQALAAISGGYPWYTYHAFIFERLPCFFAWITNTKVYATSFGADPFGDKAMVKMLRRRTREDRLRKKTPQAPDRENPAKVQNVTTVTHVINPNRPKALPRIANHNITNRNFDPALPPIRGYKEVSKHDGDLRLSKPYPGRILLYFTTYPKASHLQDMLDCWPGILDKSVLLRKSDIFVYMAGAAASNDELLANWTGALEALSLHSKRNTTLHVADNPGHQKGAMKAMDELMLVDLFWQIHFFLYAYIF